MLKLLVLGAPGNISEADDCQSRDPPEPARLAKFINLFRRSRSGPWIVRALQKADHRFVEHTSLDAFEDLKRVRIRGGKHHVGARHLDRTAAR